MNNYDILATFKKHLGEHSSDNQNMNNLYTNKKSKEFKEAFKESDIGYGHLSSMCIHSFGEHIKNINEFIGALQTLLIVFNKMSNSIKSFRDSNAEHIYIREDSARLIKLISEQIEQCYFLENPLFQTSLNASINGENLVFENPSPLPLLEQGLHNNDLNNVVAYMEDKITEINALITTLADIITNKQSFNQTAHSNQTNKNNPHATIKRNNIH